MRCRKPWIIAALIGAGLPFAVARPQAAEPIHAPATIEPIEGTTLSRVVLTSQAAIRLGIETTAVRELEIVRKRMVSGVVLELPELATAADDPALRLDAVEKFATSAGPSPTTIRKAHMFQVQVEPIGELDRMAGGRPARVLPMTDSDLADGWLVEPSATPSLGTVENASRPLFYSLPVESPGLIAPGRVLVELALSESGTVRNVVPYAALLYGVHGDTWVYTNPEPLVFVRHPVHVDYIDNDWAVLSDGPPTGTAVVAVGVAELHGAEFKIGK